MADDVREIFEQTSIMDIVRQLRDLDAPAFEIVAQDETGKVVLTLVVARGRGAEMVHEAVAEACGHVVDLTAPITAARYKN